MSQLELTPAVMKCLSLAELSLVSSHGTAQTGRKTTTRKSTLSTWLTVGWWTLTAPSTRPWYQGSKVIIKIIDLLLTCLFLASLTALVSIPPSCPETSPVFCLSLNKLGRLLLVMLHRLLGLLMLEVRSSIKEGEGGNTKTNLTKSQLFFEGRWRDCPFSIWIWDIPT